MGYMVHAVTGGGRMWTLLRVQIAMLRLLKVVSNAYIVMGASGEEPHCGCDEKNPWVRQESMCFAMMTAVLRNRYHAHDRDFS
jgi:hypothetical protein